MNKLMQKDSLKMNLFMQITYQIISIIVPIITMPYISRVLGADLIGQNSLATNIANYFLIFSMLGLTTYSSRKIPLCRNNERELGQRISSLLILHIIFSIISLVAYYIMIVFYCPVSINIMAIAGIYIVSSLLDLNWVFAALEQLKISVFRNMVVKIITIVFVFAFVKTSNDLWKYALILTCSGVICNMVMWGYFLKSIKLHKPTKEMLLEDIKYLFILFVPAIALSLYRYMDKLLVGLMASTTELGLYEQSEKIILVATALITAIGASSLPKFTNIQKKDPENIEGLLNKYAILVAFFSCSLAFGMASISPLLSNVYLGEEFAECDKLILCLSISVLFMGASTLIRYSYLIPLGHDKQYIIATFGGAIINVIVDIILIPSYGSFGAIIGTILAELVVFIFHLIAIKREKKILKSLLKFIPFIIIGLIMFIVVRLYISNNIYNIKSMIISILLGGLIFILLSVMYVYFFEKDIFYYIIKYIKHFLKKK